MEKNEEIILFGIRFQTKRENSECVSLEKTEDRNYSKSVKPRLRWTVDLHRRFLQALELAGGLQEASPKKLVEIMGVEGVSASQVKSHLQTYRNFIKREKNEPGKFQSRRHTIPDDFANSSRAQRTGTLMPRSEESCAHLQACQFNTEATEYYELGNRLQLQELRQSNAGLSLEDGDKSEVINTSY